MKNLIKYLKHYKVQTVMAPLFKMLEACFELFVPLVMANIIDIGIKNQDKSYILKMGGILLALAVIGLVCAITAQYFAAKAAMGFGKELRDDLFSHIQELSYTEIDKNGTSTLITRMTSDVNQIQTGVNMVLRLFLRSPFIVLGAVVMSFLIDVKAALVFAVVLPLLILVVFGIMFLSIPLYKKVQNKLDKVTLITRENLVGARVIRAFNREEDEKKQFHEATSDLMKMQIFVGRISALLNPVTYVIINFGIAALVYSGGIRVYDGAITQGEVVALVNYMSQILIELIKLASLIISCTKAVACANRVSDVLMQKPSLVYSENPVDYPDNLSEGLIPKVEFENVNFAYQGSKEPAISNVNIKVMPGEIIGVIGGTGSGKSTLINLIPRFYDATQGRVLVDGVDVKEYPKDELRDKIGIVPQKAVLFKGSIEDNMKWGKKDASPDEIYEALDIAQAKEFVDKKEGGIKFQLNQGAKNLSGGQKQRLCIARAVVKKPEILILDDSSSALDYATDAALRKALSEKISDTTLFIVSQRSSSISHADKIIVMDDGQVAGIGTHKDLLKNCEVYREICLSQMSGEEAEAYE